MTKPSQPKIHILYENEDWLTPLASALDKIGAPYQGMKIIEGSVDLNEAAPEGIFFNRLSASSHTRGHTGSIALGGAILSWLENQGRRIINGRNVLDLEVRKFDQYTKLKAAGIKVPHTQAVIGSDDEILKAAAQFGEPFIIKPNRGGKGLGVRLFQTLDELKAALKQEPRDFASEDGVYLIQEYIKGKKPEILRNEFIGGEYYYSVRVNTEAGFELCPADACCIIDAQKNKETADGEKFEILDGFTHPLKDQYATFLKANGIEVAAFESIEAEDGTLYTYDINTNTNYNQSAESTSKSDVSAYDRVAAFLSQALEKNQ